MKLSLVTYYSEDEPYKTMAKRAVDTFVLHHRDCECLALAIDEPGFGREFFGEAMARIYPTFSRMLVDGPVVLVGADCYFQKSIEPFIREHRSGWDVVAVRRGNINNSYGNQSYIGIMIFNDEQPNVCRKFWLDWVAEIYDFVVNPRPEPEQGVGPHNDMLAKMGWTETWFADQAALNSTLDGFKKERILPLRADVFSARLGRPGISDAIIVHEKGSAKLK